MIEYRLPVSAKLPAFYKMASGNDSIFLARCISLDRPGSLGSDLRLEGCYVRSVHAPRDVARQTWVWAKDFAFYPCNEEHPLELYYPNCAFPMLFRSVLSGNIFLAHSVNAKNQIVGCYLSNGAEIAKECAEPVDTFCPLLTTAEDPLMVWI